MAFLVFVDEVLPSNEVRLGKELPEWFRRFEFRVLLLLAMGLLEMKVVEPEETLDVERVERALEVGQLAEDGGVYEGRKQGLDEVGAEVYKVRVRWSVFRGVEGYIERVGEGVKILDGQRISFDLQPMKARQVMYTGERQLALAELGSSFRPRRKIFRLTAPPLESTHASQSASSARCMRGSSPEKRSSGQYLVPGAASGALSPFRGD